MLCINVTDHGKPKAVTFFPANILANIFLTTYETSELAGYTICLNGESWSKILFNLLIQSSDLFH